MSARPNTVERIAEQNRKNIAALAKELGVEKHLEGDDYTAEWTQTFALRESEPEEKTAAEETADVLAQNAENIVRLAEAVGVSKHRVEGKATKADWTKVYFPDSGEE